MTKVVPAGPKFFCAPAYIKSNFETSIFLLKISEDISQTTLIGESGNFFIWVPSIVNPPISPSLAVIEPLNITSPSGFRWNPEDDISTLENVVFVMKEGVIYKN